MCVSARHHIQKAMHLAIYVKIASSYPLLKAWKMPPCSDLPVEDGEVPLPCAFHLAARRFLPLAAILRCGSVPGPKTSKEPSRDVALVCLMLQDAKSTIIEPPVVKSSGKEPTYAYQPT